MFELQNINQLNQNLSGCLETVKIAAEVTDGLVTIFNCSFARIWLVEEDRTALKLIASSGMYTRLDGDFARVPMGAYKVGKIAQNCIPFLSNQLAEESWVKDRNWAIANKICGCAALPLEIADQAIGVLAVFSHQPMAAEFLEALRILCSSVAVALDNAKIYQQQREVRFQELTSQSQQQHLTSILDQPLSEKISVILNDVRLTLVGKEVSLSVARNYIVLSTVEILKAHNCNYCRLTYGGDRLYLEGMLITNGDLLTSASELGDIAAAVNAMGGRLQSDIDQDKIAPDNIDNITQVKLSLPYEHQPKSMINLSQREQEVIQLLARGMRDREIAQKLFISDRTVKFHVNNALAKLSARTRIQAIHQAYSQGYLNFQ